MLSDSNNRRRSHQADVERYRRLLRTPVTDIERRFVRRGLVEEQQACREPSVRPAWRSIRKSTARFDPYNGP